MNQQVMEKQCFPSPALMQALADIHTKLKTLGKRLELVVQRRMAEENYLGDESYLVEEENEPPDPLETLPWMPTPPLAIEKEKPVKIVAPLSQTVVCINQDSMTTTKVLENHNLKTSFRTKEEQTVTKLMGVGDSRNTISVSDQKNKNGIIYSLLIKEAKSNSNNTYNWNEQVLRTKLCQEGENDEVSKPEPNQDPNEAVNNMLHQPFVGQTFRNKEDHNKFHLFQLDEVKGFGEKIKPVPYNHMDVEETETHISSLFGPESMKPNDHHVIPSFGGAQNTKEIKLKTTRQPESARGITWPYLFKNKELSLFIGSRAFPTKILKKKDSSTSRSTNDHSKDNIK